MTGMPYKCFVRAFIDADCIFAAKYMKSNPDGYKILSSDKVQVINNINVHIYVVQFIFLLLHALTMAFQV